MLNNCVINANRCKAIVKLLLHTYVFTITSQLHHIPKVTLMLYIVAPHIHRFLTPVYVWEMANAWFFERMHRLCPWKQIQMLQTALKRSSEPMPNCVHTAKSFLSVIIYLPTQFLQ